MPTDDDYVDGIKHELETMGEGFSARDAEKIAELKRLLAVFENGRPDKADRSDARAVLHPSWRNVQRLRGNE